jgi:hypothetical protein
MLYYFYMRITINGTNGVRKTSVSASISFVIDPIYTFRIQSVIDGAYELFTSLSECM